MQINWEIVGSSRVSFLSIFCYFWVAHFKIDSLGCINDHSRKKIWKKYFKNKIKRAKTIFLLPKARWAEMGSQFLKISLPIMQKISNCHMFEWYYRKMLWEGKGVWGSIRGFVPDPWICLFRPFSGVNLEPPSRPPNPLTISKGFGLMPLKHIINWSRLSY